MRPREADSVAVPVQPSLDAEIDTPPPMAKSIHTEMIGIPDGTFRTASGGPHD